MRARTAGQQSIELKTHDAERQVILEGVELFNASSGRATLVVHSSGLQCRRDFAFDNLEEFLASLQRIEAGIQDEAVLGENYSDEHLTLRLLSLGHIEVTGQIIDHGDVLQTLSFGFRTDQTILGPLTQALEAIVGESRK
ncbi:MAG: hypothetical protein AAGD01_09575 [Acidobacteriota bacterium]